MKTLHIAIIGILLLPIVNVSGQNQIIPIESKTKGNITSYNIPGGFGFAMPADTYRPGDNIIIVGRVNPNTVIKITLKDPHGKTVGSTQSFSDAGGVFSLLNFRIPDNAIFGVWNVHVTDGITDYVKPLVVEYLSPLKQFKSGTEVRNTNCNPGLELIIKREDRSPACVTTSTAHKLIEKQWSNEVVESQYNPNQKVSVVSIKMVPPYTPGGPIIQLTLKNIGMKSITSLKAVLELYNNYTFDFKDVTSSTPLTSGDSTTDKEMLIGGGFQTEWAYPLIISGMEDNMPFEYTQKVHIQG